MPQPTQPIFEAIQRGEKQQAIELLKQALSIDPYDIEMLLILATLVDEPTRKRQVLNRVLSREPVNKAARDMLLEMDRAELSAYRLKPNLAPPPKAATVPAPQAPIDHPSSRPEFASLPAQQVETPFNAEPQISPNARIERPLVFAYSGPVLILLYLLTALSLCGGVLFLAAGNVPDSVRCFVPALFMGLFALSVTSKVVVSETGIRSSNLLSSAEIQWNDIASIKPNSSKRKLNLVSKKGKSVNISTQVKDYHALIEILRQKRPDLFGTDLPSPTQEDQPAAGYQQPQAAAAPAFTGTKTFEKSFFRQYGWTFGGIFFCLAVIWMVASVDVHWDLFTGIGILLVVAMGALMILVPFFSVSAIKLEPSKLTLSSFFGEKEYSAHQIQEIKIESIHYRRGQKNFVQISFSDGKPCGVDGFADGPEVIYGYLMNWWNAYRNT
jgi:hypothetical protein